MSDKTHYRLSPSSSACWTVCTQQPSYVASLNLPPDKGSVYAAMGTLAHDYAEKILTHLLKGGPEFTLQDIPAGAWPAHLQDDYVQCVNDYVTRCMEVARLPGDVEIEKSVQLFYAPNDPLAKGTCDFCHISEDRKIVTIRDLKAGAGVPVDAEFNTQMATYAYSFICESEHTFTGETIVIMEIDQPRGYTGDGPVSRWEISAAGLKDFCDNAILPAVQDINAGTNLVFSPGEKSCRWCRGKEVCPARGEKLEVLPFDVLEPSTDGLEIINPEVKSLTVEQLVSIYKNAPMIKQICEDAGDYLLELALAGQVPEGLKLVEGRQGNRKWVDSDKVERMLARAHIKEKQRFKFTLRSVKEVFDLPEVKSDEKLAGKLESLVCRAPGSPKLALDDDKRPVLDLTAGLTPILTVAEMVDEL